MVIMRVRENKRIVRSKKTKLAQRRQLRKIWEDGHLCAAEADHILKLRPLHELTSLVGGSSPCFAAALRTWRTVHEAWIARVSHYEHAIDRAIVFVTHVKFETSD